MTAVLPPPVELPDPPGDPTVLAAALDGLAGAAFSLGVAGAHLLGPAARAPEWLGADASAAAAQTATTATVVDVMHDAVTTAVAAVGAHHEELVAARSRLVVLRDEQDADFVDAQARLAVLVDPGAQVSSAVDPPGVAPVLAGLEAAEADRATEHAALLTCVDEHAGSTGAVLSGALVGLGGDGAGGPTGAGVLSGADAVTLHLAAVLPGHGTSVLLDLGWQAARALTAPGTAADVEASAQRFAGVLADPVVAAAAVVALGESGVTQLLTQLGAGGAQGATDPFARVLATALGAAATVGTRVPGAAPVLDGLLDPDDPSGAPDVVAVGMGAVLAAPGAGADLAGSWARQLFAREAVQGAAVSRVPGAGADPVAVALDVVRRAGRPDVAADVLARPEAWRVLLSRSWADGGTGLAELVSLAGRSGPAAEGVVTAALTSVGADLLPESALVVTADQQTWALLAPVLTRVAVEHPAGLLAALADPGTAGALPVLAGAGLLMATPARRSEVAGAVEGAVAGTSSAAAVTGGLVAVEDQSRRLAWLLPYAQERQEAAGRKIDYDLFVSMPLLVVRGPVGEGLQALAAVVAPGLHADGYVDAPPPLPLPTGPGGVAARVTAVPGVSLDPAQLSVAQAAHDQVLTGLLLPGLPPLPPTPFPDLPVPDRSHGWLSRWSFLPR